MERFDLLRTEAEQAFAAGELDKAAGLYGEAEQYAAEHGRSDLADLAFCIRCGVLIELDKASDEIPRLKRLILSGSDMKTRWMATYYTAVAYDLDDETDKAFPYARRAREIGAELNDPAVTARCANLTGTLALRTSNFDEAERSYTEAIEAHQGLDGYHRIYEAMAHDNLGYVLMCTDRLESGLRRCEEALSRLESLEGEHEVAQTLQDLCYGYILDNQLARAQECGERSLELALDGSDPLIVKNVLFLLAEIGVRRGDTFRARRYLRELTEHYPEVGVSEEIIDVFLTTDLTSVVNLRG